MIWTGSVKEQKYFFTRVNSDHATIKFECKYSNKEINFLDTIVCIIRSNTLITKLYKKETDRNAYLCYKSYHPSKLKENIPYGQFLRIRRICSNDNDTDDSMEVLTSNFNKGGYPDKILQQQLIKAKTTDRKELLKEKENISSQLVHFTTTFNKNLPAINSVLDKHWHLLQTNSKIGSSIMEKPRLTFRRNKNLKGWIGQTHLSHNKKITTTKNRKSGSSSACLSRANNQCCKHVISIKTFRSHKTGLIYQIRHNVNCHSRNIIGECNLCPNTQYVGKSEPPVNLRINTHRYEVNNPKSLAFDKHFLLPGHNFNANARFTLIEQVRTTTNSSKQTIRQLLENRELPLSQFYQFSGVWKIFSPCQ